MGSLGKYELRQQLGTGSMGTVYVARDSVLDREVALKTIRTGTEVDPEIRERFYREARTCAKLQHPNVVTIYDLAEHDGFAYIAMELLNGSDLRRVIEQKTAIPLTSKLEAMVRICEALAYAHREGIVHRDVKPSNLFMDTEGRVKVLDFGIARLPSSRLTVVGRVLGTPNYMAPEQILGHKTDGRADLFSAAVVFFELLVHQHPFQATLVPRRIVDGEPDSLFDFDSTVPVPFERIFERAFQKNPDRRYSTGDEFAGDLRAVLEAIRLNSSPTFSKLNLPSLSSSSMDSSEPVSVSNPAPDSADPEEWRLSEFLRVLPEFEDAIEARKLSWAAKVLEQLKAIQAVDSRFTESVALCTARLDELSSSEAQRAPAAAELALGAGARIATRTSVPVSTETQPVALSGNADLLDSTVYFREQIVAAEAAQLPAPAEQLEEASRAECPYCGRTNRLRAVFCSECGSQLTNKNAGRSFQTSATTESPDRGAVDNRSEVSAETPVQRAQSPGAVESFTGLFRQRKATVVIIGGVVLCTILLLALFLILRGPSLAPFVATATVASVKADVYSSASATDRLLTVTSGTKVHILRLPNSGSDKMLPVQAFDEGKPADRGFMRRADLTGFDAQNDRDAMILARLLAPLINPTESDLRRQIAAFRKAATKFPGVRKIALIEAAGHEVALASFIKATDPSATEWQVMANEAKDTVAAFTADPAAREIQDAAKALFPPVAPPPDSQPLAEPPVDQDKVSALIAKGENSQREYDYDNALAAAKQVLDLDPNNKGAKDLRRRAWEAKRAEQSTVH